jgi:hypothetical protein
MNERIRKTNDEWDEGTKRVVSMGRRKARTRVKREIT